MVGTGASGSRCVDEVICDRINMQGFFFQKVTLIRVSLKTGDTLRSSFARDEDLKFSSLS
jgi:hypothetical protein